MGNPTGLTPNRAGSTPAADRHESHTPPSQCAQQHPSTNPAWHSAPRLNRSPLNLKHESVKPYTIRRLLRALLARWAVAGVWMGMR